MISLKTFAINFYQWVPSLGIYVDSITTLFLCLILQPFPIFVITFLIAYSYMVIVAMSTEFSQQPPFAMLINVWNGYARAPSLGQWVLPIYKTVTLFSQPVQWSHVLLPYTSSLA